MLNLILELEKAGGTPISLTYDNPDSTLRLFRGGDYDCWPYFLSLEPAEHFREEMRTLIVRFLKAFSIRFGMQNFTESIYYDWARDTAEEELADMEAHPDTYDEEDLEDYRYVSENYKENGPLWDKLNEFEFNTVPLREEELDSFIPTSAPEKDILSMIRKGFSLIAREGSIWDWVKPAFNEFYDEEGNPREDAEGDMLVLFSDVFTVVWKERDSFTQRYMNFVDGDLNSGGVAQSLSDWEEITPEIDRIYVSSFPREVLKFIDDWNTTMEEKTRCNNQ